MAVFSFGQDLGAFESADSAFPPGEGVGEECVETLVARNLGTFFPGWHLRLCQMSNAGWGVPDLIAADPAGGLHVFEVKDGGAEKGLLEQALGYALTAAARRPRAPWNETEPWADREFIATRIGGFWLPRGKHRTDKLPASDVPFRQRSARRLESVCAMLPCEPTHLLSLAQGWPSPEALEHWVQRDVHVHVIADFGSRGDTTLIERSRELGKRGVRISLWDLSVRRDVSARRGWARLQAVTDEMLPMKWLATLADADVEIATCWSWSYEAHHPGVGAYARAPVLLGEAVVMALLDLDRSPLLHWNFNVPAFATADSYRVRVRECRAFARKLAGKLEEEVGIKPNVSAQGVRLQLPEQGWETALASALRVVKDLSNESGKLLQFS